MGGLAFLTSVIALQHFYMPTLYSRERRVEMKEHEKQHDAKRMASQWAQLNKEMRKKGANINLPPKTE